MLPRKGVVAGVQGIPKSWNGWVVEHPCNILTSFANRMAQRKRATRAIKVHHVRLNMFETYPPDKLVH
jgi:hypothetical protein